LESAENTFAVRGDVFDVRDQYLLQNMVDNGLYALNDAALADADLVRQARKRFFLAQEDVDDSAARLKSIYALYKILPGYGKSARDKDLLKKMDDFLQEYRKKLSEEWKSFDALNLDTAEASALARKEVKRMFEDLFWNVAGNPYRENGLTREIAERILKQANKNSDEARKAYETLSNWSYLTYSLSFFCAILAAIGGAHDSLPKPA
jgi:hypothetical protein